MQTSNERDGAPLPDPRLKFRLLPASELRDAIAAETPPSRFHVLQDLIGLAHEQLDRQPSRALEIMDVVIPFVDHVEIPDDASTSRVGFRAGALKVYAHALTPTQPRKAEQAILEAIRIADEGDDPRLKATLQLVLALVLDASEDSLRALAAARRATSLFEEAADPSMLLTARQIEGSVLVSLGRAEEARQIYLWGLDEARRQGDSTSETRILNNLGTIGAGRGDHAEAFAYLTTASARFRDLGMTVEATRARWGASRIAISVGQYASALGELEAVRAELDAAGCSRDAMIASLEIARTLTLLDRDAEARTLNFDAADWFRSADLPSLTAKALEQLRAAWPATGGSAATNPQRGPFARAGKHAAALADAEQTLEQLLDSQYVFEFARIADRERFRTSAIIRRLCRAAREKGRSEPLFSAGLAKTAAMIAERLAYEDGREGAFSELRGMAWLEYAAAGRSAKRFAESLGALARAERAYCGLPSIDEGLSGVELRVDTPRITMTVAALPAEALPTKATGHAGLASVELGRAIAYRSTERWEEALTSARSAGGRFAAHADAAGLFESKQIEAWILERKGNPAAASTVCEMMLTFARTMNDRELEARGARNLGVARLACGEHEAARTLFVDAAHTFQRLGRPADAARARAGVARAISASGRADEAITLFRSVAAELERLALPADAALVKLDLAETLLLSGRDELKRLCTSLVTWFRSETTLFGAVTAASFLAGQAEAGTLTREQIGDVRTYVEDLGGEPGLAFPPRLD